MSNLREMRNRRDLRGAPLEIISLYAQLKIGDSKKLTKEEILELNVEELCNKVKLVSLKRGSQKYIPILMKKICQVQDEKAALLLTDARRLLEKLDKLLQEPKQFPPIMDCPPEFDPNIPPPEDTDNIGDEFQTLIHERERDIGLNIPKINLEEESDEEDQQTVLVPEVDEPDFLPLGTADVFYEDFAQMGDGDIQPEPWQDEAAALPSIAELRKKIASAKTNVPDQQTEPVFKTPLVPDVKQKSKRRKTPKKQLKVIRKRYVQPKLYTEIEPEREVETLTVCRLDENEYDFGELIENLEKLRAEKMPERPKMPEKKKKMKKPKIIITPATPSRDSSTNVPQLISPSHLSPGERLPPESPYAHSQQGSSAAVATATSDAQQAAQEGGAAAVATATSDAQQEGAAAVTAAPSVGENVDLVEVASISSDSTFTKTNKIELKISETVEKHNVGDFIKLQEMTHWPDSKEALKETFVVLMDMIENLPLVVEYEEGTLFFIGVRKVPN